MKKNFVKSLNVLLVIVFFITLYSCFTYFTFIYNKNKVTKEIENEIAVINKNPKYDLNYYKNYYNNNDIVGRIKINNTKIDSLLVKTNNNTFYLNHGLNKEYDEKGSIFLDYRTNLNSKQINIYGHNSNVYDLQFRDLEKYLDKKFYDNNKYIELWDGINTFIYEIFSVQIISNDYEHIDVDPKDINEHINKLNNSIYNTDIKAVEEDNILILQTCLYEPVDSYIIINSKKIGENNE